MIAIKKYKGIRTFVTDNWILSIGKCWIDNSIGYIYFPKDGEVKIKKICKSHKSMI